MSVPTKNDFRKIIKRKAIIGEMSMPNLKLGGKNLLIGFSIGSVVLYKNWTIGLYGSGLTQLTSALIKISQYKNVKIYSSTMASDDKKLDKTNTYSMISFNRVISYITKSGLAFRASALLPIP